MGHDWRKWGLKSVQKQLSQAVAKANLAVVSAMASRLATLDAVTFSPKPVNVTGLPLLCDHAAAAGHWLVPLDYALGPAPPPLPPGPSPPAHS